MADELRQALERLERITDSQGVGVVKRFGPGGVNRSGSTEAVGGQLRAVACSRTPSSTSGCGVT